MVARRLLVWLLLCWTTAAAQERRPEGVVRPQTSLRLQREVVALPPSERLVPRPQSSDTIRVLAIMVDFQRDTDSQTTGDGGFQTIAPTSKQIDPPPHDSSYFAFKLQFLSNYFRKVSNGKVQIRGEVLRRVITLSKPMESYSPPKGSFDNRRLADLVIDSWRTADSLYPTLPFSRYDAFAIFHAGVGRDVDLVSALGYDPTPKDIPSLTVNLRTLREFLKDPSYNGVPVSKGTFRITNTMILPETQTRPIPGLSRTDTLQGSINGLLANSFGSILGLPDLFNTKDGSSGIGGFGLMDIAGSIYFYAGLFPPEPSAWEKAYLGWVTPITVGPGTSVLSLPAVGLTSVGQDTIYKIPINDREYFLIENRHRDPLRNGQRLTIREGNFTITRAFPDDAADFNLSIVGAINGSVIDVEDFDWALPGYSPVGEEYRGGGILIWHIDEDVIAKGLTDNTVNASPNHRGIDLEEASGSQDIGRVFDLLEPGSGTEFGSPLDCWYAENPSSAYTNLFDRSTAPNTKSYSGALSLVAIKNFSARSPRMTASVQIGDERVQRISGFNQSLVSGGVPPTVLGSTIIVCSNTKLYAFRPDGSSKTLDPTGLLAAKGGGYGVAGIEMGDGTSILAGAQDSSLYIWTVGDRNADGIIDTIRTIVVPLGERVSFPPMIADVSITRAILVIGHRGSVWQVDFNGAVQRKSTISTNDVSSIAQLPTPSLSRPTEVFYASGDRLYSDQTSVSLGDSSSPWLLAGSLSRSGNFVVASQQGGAKVIAWSQSLSSRLFEFSLPEGGISSIAAADLDADGSGDIIVLARSRLIVLNRSGAVLEGFPIASSGEKSFVGFPLVADADGDGFLDILVLQSSGELLAFDRFGRAREGFPLQFVSAGETSPALFRTSEGKVGLLGISPDGALRALQLSTTYSAERTAWSQYLGDPRHANAGGSTTVVVVPPSALLPESRVYNWPNPVYGSTTQIRFYSADDAEITITILDLTGAQVAELKTRAQGGYDGEIAWDVSNIQSGVYLARVEAATANRTEVAVIKIAVVK